MYFRCAQELTLAVAHWPSQQTPYSTAATLVDLCHLKQSLASCFPAVDEREHSFLYTCCTRGRKNSRQRVSSDKSSKSHPQFLPLTELPCCPAGCSRWIPGPETHFTTNYHSPPTHTPSNTGTDSLTHDEGEFSPKSSVIPGLPSLSVHQAHLICQPQLSREFKPFSSKPSTPLVSHWVSESTPDVRHMSVWIQPSRKSLCLMFEL